MADQATRARQRSWRVPAGDPRIRLDAFVRRCLPHLSRRHIAEGIAKKFFTVAARAAKKGEQLRAGAEVRFVGPEEWLFDRPIPQAALAVPLIYDDASMVAVNKPAGMATHGFSGRAVGTVANFLVARFPEIITVGANRWEPGLIHRLDIDTSGVVLAAKTAAAFTNLKAQLRRREMRKIYWALVHGAPPPCGVVDRALEHDPSDRRRMRPASGAAAGARGQPWRAVTRYRTLDRAAGLTLLEVEIETGVTHQIRVHLSALGHPLVGDRLYGAPTADCLGLARHFLHARSLALRHPSDGRALYIRAELSEDLAGLLQRLQLRF